MKVEDIHRIAELARLRYTDDEAAAFAAQFENIISYVGTISSVNMDAVEPLAAVNDHVNVLRDDVVGECLTTDQALANAPKKNEAFIKVPKVLG
jgi:aspartyl-tRNA(Asn)/glutamyl-tRNA(Gln) amidotransferase subunit C